MGRSQLWRQERALRRFESVCSNEGCALLGALCAVIVGSNVCGGVPALCGDERKRYIRRAVFLHLVDVCDRSSFESYRCLARCAVDCRGFSCYVHYVHSSDFKVTFFFFTVGAIVAQ